MEKYFEVKKDSDFYKKYFAFVDSSAKLNELFREFSADNGIETKTYYQTTERLAIEPTERDKFRFRGLFKQNSNTDFKKTSKISKKWVTLCKERGVTTPRKPNLLWDSDCNIGSYNIGSRLFHIGEKLYGSINNKCEANIELTDDFIEMKASEFYKIIEENEDEQ